MLQSRGFVGRKLDCVSAWLSWSCYPIDERRMSEFAGLSVTVVYFNLIYSNLLYFLFCWIG
jgi:hypothetical protein